MAAETAPPRLLFVDDPRFERHVPPLEHPESPERLVAARRGVTRTGIPVMRVAAREATDDELTRVHTPAFIEELTRLRGHAGYLDPDTYIGPASVDAARLAAGSVVAMVDAMLDGTDAMGIALVRPPGHHAGRGRAMGFCLLNNVAIAAAHARERGLKRVAIVDWDVHHGNGTQEIFYDQPGVLYLSTHQAPFYPGTGESHEVGEGDGTGFTVNVPLSAGGGDGVYAAAFERVILPVLDAYRPELVLVSAGFDAAAPDPLAQMQLSPDAFGFMACALSKVSEVHSGSRIALVLEGGYHLSSLEAGVAAALQGMHLRTAPKIPAVFDPDVERAARSARVYWPEVG